MKIIYLKSQLFIPGGVERVLCNKANWLVRHGYEVTIVTTDQQGRPPFYDFDPAIKMVDLGVDFLQNGTVRSAIKRKWLYIAKIRKYKTRLAQYLKEHPSDVVISMFGEEFRWLPSIVDGSRKIAEPHIIKQFRMTFKRQGIRGMLDRNRSSLEEKTIPRYDRFVVLSQAEQRSWGNKENIRVIPNATSFVPGPQAISINKQAIALGRLHEDKGFDLLIRAWEIVHDTHTDWKLAIYGEGPLKEPLQEQICTAGLQGIVTIFAPTTDVAGRLRESALYVLSSRNEGFGMVLVEAMSQGVPAVAFDCKTGPREIITHEMDGLLVEEGDVQKLAAAIELLIEDESLRHRLGGNALKTIHERFSEEVVMRQWDTLFKSIEQ